MDDVRLTTINDARRIISAWTERYLEQPTTEQVDRVIRRLVAHIGGYGHDLTEALSQTFDLDAALEGRYSGDIRNRIRQAWADEDWEMVDSWLPQAVREAGHARDIMHDLEALLALTDELAPGYLDQTQV